MQTIDLTKGVSSMSKIELAKYLDEILSYKYPETLFAFQNPEALKLWKKSELQDKAKRVQRILMIGIFRKVVSLGKTAKVLYRRHFRRYGSNLSLFCEHYEYQLTSN